MNIIIAIDSFKGCLSSALANQSAADGVLSVSADVKVVQMPVSDGGEGWLSAYHAAIGGELITKTVRDPLMRWIEAQYLVKDQTAVVEIAQASGLPLLTAEERNPMVATSYGTGQLIVDAVRRGCKEIIVGLGGSATSDCGKGMLRAIIDAFAQQGTWDDITELQNVRFTIATDVTNPILSADPRALPMSLPLRKALPPRWYRNSTPSPDALPTSLPSTSASIVRMNQVQVLQAVSAMPSCNI